MQVQFDLSRAAVEAAGERMVLVPASSLDLAVKSLPEAAKQAFASAIGQACGARALSNLGGRSAIAAVAIEQVVAKLAAELSLLGIGVVSTEQWGKALFVRIDHAAIQDSVWLERVVASAFGELAGKELSAASVGEYRFFVGSPGTCARARELAKTEKSLGTIVGKLEEKR